MDRASPDWYSALPVRGALESRKYQNPVVAFRVSTLCPTLSQQPLPVKWVVIRLPWPGCPAGAAGMPRAIWELREIRDMVPHTPPS